MKVLRNADEVIEVLSAEGPQTPAEIADRTGIPRPSVYRLLDGLHSVGLTEPMLDSRSALSLDWLHLADSARRAMREWDGARDALSALVDRTGQTAFLSIIRREEAVCIEWVQGRDLGVLLLKPGRSLPLHAGAAGRLLLAFASDVDSYLESTERRRFTALTLTGADELRADVEQTRERGFSVSDGDVTDGIGALGIPVRARGGRVAGALSLAGLARDIRGRQERLVRELDMTAGALERGL